MSRGNLSIGMSSFESLTPEEREWVIRDERRWRRAHQIASRNSGVDVGGIYRVIRNLEKSPSERLRAALHHGRLFGAHRG
jgi:hypothetical protein